MKPTKVASSDVPMITARGGIIRILISPKNTGGAEFILGVSSLEPDGVVNNHVHDFSHEAFFVLKGEGVISFENHEAISFGPGDAVHVPKGTAHKIRNTGSDIMQVVFTASPLAPSPELGHREI